MWTNPSVLSTRFRTIITSTQLICVKMAGIARVRIVIAVTILSKPRHLSGAFSLMNVVNSISWVSFVFLSLLC